MSKYIAIQDIGQYSAGQEVPKSEAEVWIKMYKVSPVRLEDGLPISEKKEDFDLNNDGKVDKEDSSLAAKVLRKSKHFGRKR